MGRIFFMLSDDLAGAVQAVRAVIRRKANGSLFFMLSDDLAGAAQAARAVISIYQEDKL